MTEEKMNTLRQADTNLRDALRMDEAERPQMPANLNERLMQRMAVSEKPVKRRIVWPWIAAACVAGVMMIWLIPPKEETLPVAKQTPSPTLPLNGKEVISTEVSKVEEPVVAKVETKTASRRTPKDKQIRKTQITPTPQAAASTPQAAASTPQAAEPITDLAAVQEKEVSTPLPSGEGQGGGSAVTLSERDIPITRPENYHYTAEEIALMKKQANEAYLRWAKLELEIAKHNLEQTAQK